jgi:hypothetical protein
MTDYLKIIEDILDIEVDMLQRIRSANSAPCQDAPKTFRNIRESIYKTWTKEMLLSYKQDLLTAQKNDKNLVLEKYARMDNLIPPLKENPLIEKIVEIENYWQVELQEKYPIIYKKICRNNNNICNGSNFVIYLKSELETYSNNTLLAYYKHVKNSFKNSENLALKSLENLILTNGYNNLDHAEICLKNFSVSR